MNDLTLLYYDLVLAIYIYRISEPVHVNPKGSDVAQQFLTGKLGDRLLTMCFAPFQDVSKGIMKVRYSNYMILHITTP